MREKLLPRLLHRPCGDPGLLVHVIVEGYEFLFDLPHINHVSTRILRRTKAVFVTHTHVDHFVGIGHFLRVNLTRDDTVALVGPAGFVANVEGFLSAVTWNLGEDYPLSLPAHEVGEEEFTFPQKLPTLKSLTEQLIEEALSRAKGNQAIAAGLLGITPQALSKRLKRRKDSQSQSDGD